MKRRDASGRQAATGTRVDQSLSRADRMTSSSAYAQCYKQGRRMRDALVGAFFLATATSQGESGRTKPRRGPRLGVTVTKKFGGSVARHRAKRWAREIFRRSEWRRRLPEGDLVLHLYPAARDEGFHHMKHSIENQLSRLSRASRGPRRRRGRAS